MSERFDALTLDRRLVWVDLETTAKEKAAARIVQIGLIVVEPDGTIAKRWGTLVDPGVPIPAEVTAVHGIRDEDVAGKPTFKQLAANLLTGFAGADFGGYNVSFDLDVLVEEFRRLGTVFDPSAARRLDGKRLWTLLEPRTLADAVQRFLKRPHADAHDAVADISETLEVVVAQLAELAAKDPALLGSTIADAHAAQFPRDPNWIDADGKFAWRGDTPIVNFGKRWKGVDMRRVDKGYYEWIISSEFSAEAKRLAREALQGRFPARPAVQQ